MSIILQDSDVPDQVALDEAVGRLRKDAELMKVARGKKNTENEKSLTIVANFLEMLSKRINKNP
jgi:hypothetical protein